MAHFNLVGLIATTWENVTYLTGFEGWTQRSYRTRLNCAIMGVPADRRPTLILNSADITYFAAFGADADAVYAYGGQLPLVFPDGHDPIGEEEGRLLELSASAGRFSTAIDVLIHDLTEQGMAEGRIGVDLPQSSPMLQALAERLPSCQFVAASDLFLMIRLVKTSAEIERLRCAARINENGMWAALDAMAPGVTEQDVAGVWRGEVARQGAMWHWFHLGTGRRSVFNFPPTNRLLAHGDLFLLDVGLTHRNYSADTGCCGSVGEPAKEDLRRYEAIDRGVEAVLQTVKSGTTGGQIYATMIETIKESGFPEFNAKFAGHTIGLEAREIPFILGPETSYAGEFLPSTSDFPLPAGAVVNVEAPIGVIGRGGYHIEKTLLVTENGCELLIPQERPFQIVH